MADLTATRPHASHGPSRPHLAANSLVPAVVKEIDDPTPAGIAAAINRLIRSGQLAVGDRLPTVRQLAGELGVSPSTVNDAWQALGAVGAIHPRGRAGTFVADAPLTGRKTRFASVGAAPSTSGIDLSTGIPDPALLPPLRHALARVMDRPGPLTTSYLGAPVLPELEELLRRTWPFPAARFTVVDGAQDALSRLVDQLVHLGDRVVMEDPGFPPLIDMLERAGAQIIPVPLDEEGMVVSDLERVLQTDPVAVFLQPRAQNPTGTSMSVRRARKIAQALRDRRAWIIEDDHSGDIARTEDISIGTYLPDRVIHIRSYSKSHGPDLRIAAVGGAEQIVEELTARRMLGPAWTSRLLQAVLVALLTDQAAVDAVVHARDTYAARSLALREALERYGVTTTSGDGINLWIEVANERSALLALAAQGLRVAPGSPFTIWGNGVDHLRVTTGLLNDDDPEQIEQIAESLAIAAGKSTSQRGI